MPAELTKGLTLKPPMLADIAAKAVRGLAPALLCGLLTFCSSPLATAVLAQDASSQSSSSAANADDAAIRGSADDFVSAFNRHDAKAIAQLWTEDADYVDEAGQKYQGRETIEQEYEKFFQNHDGVELKVNVGSIRLINPTTAIEDGTAVLEPQPIGAPGMSRYVAVHSKQSDGRWLLASVRDSRVEVPTTYDQLLPLELLVGDWTAEHGGAQAEVSGRWNSQKTFLERRFVVTRDGEVVSSSTEIIGLDPVTQQVTSWTFSSDGGRAKGIWIPLKDGWVVQNQGITADGISTSSVDVWAPLLDGALGWRSTQRSAGGTAVKDSAHVVLKPKTAAASAKD